MIDSPLRMLGVLVLVFVALTSSAVAADPKPIDYDRDIRPILAEHCFACHGPDANARKADLRLDRKSDAFASRDDGPAVVPGDPETSNLVFRVETDDPELQMPPAKFKKPLNQAQKTTLRQWISQGASWSEHWAFIPPKQPEVPSASAPDRIQTPVDAFILARLEQESLTPSPEADRVTLIRRLSLDLIGLPPTHRGSRCLPRRLGTGRLRPARRAPARLASLRRALGPPLARRRPLRRFRRLREGQVPLRLGLSRLGHQRPESRPAVRPVHRRADSPATCLPDASQDQQRGHRLPAKLDDQRGRGHRPRTVPHGSDVRPHGRHRQGHPRA